MLPQYALNDGVKSQSIPWTQDPSNPALEVRTHSKGGGFSIISSLFEVGQTADPFPLRERMLRCNLTIYSPGTSVKLPILSECSDLVSEQNVQGGSVIKFDRTKDAQNLALDNFRVGISL